MDNIKFTIKYGHSRLKQFSKFENGRMVTYGYRIDYDIDGNETGRTKPEKLSSMEWSDSSPSIKYGWIEWFMLVGLWLAIGMAIFGIIYS